MGHGLISMALNGDVDGRKRSRKLSVPREDRTWDRDKIKLTCSPTITALRFSTGFQSSLRIFRQTFPSRSMFGW